jgi:group I intron endonuclease
MFEVNCQLGEGPVINSVYIFQGIYIAPKIYIVCIQILLINGGDIMSKIYKIVNDINDKVYVGKTLLPTIEMRFKQHCQDAVKKRMKKRPLYSAMNKYGIEHFSIELIEECSEEEASLREQYWIGFYKSYTEGYNATLGGDGKTYIDINEVLLLWEDGKSIKEIAQILGHDANWLSLRLKEYIPNEEIQKRATESKSKQVQMLDRITGQVLQEFNSTRDAARYLIKAYNLKPTNEGGYSAHISEVCRGLRKSCKGFNWRYNAG